mgnify:FL=1
MVNIKRIGSGILGAGAVLFVAAGAEAGLPTFDAANIAGTMSIVKNGSQNLKGIGDITNKVGELNTIVGDAAASVSKFQEQYGDEINKGMEMAQKAMARKAEAEAAKAAHDAEVQAQKDAYQAALDSVAENQQASQPEEEYYEEVEEEVVNTPEETAAVVEGADEDFYGEDAEENGVSSAMNSANRVYDDGDYEETGGENLDGIAGDDKAAAEDGGAPVKTLQNLPEGMQAVQMKPAVVGKVQAAGDEGGVSANRRRAFVRPSAPNAEAAVVSSGLKAVSADTEADVEAAPAEGEASDTAAVSASPAAVRAETPAAQAAPVQRRQFRVSPRLNRVEKVSRSTYGRHEEMAFASSSDDGEAVGNSYVGNVYIVPMAQRCEISAQTFINDEQKRNECIEKIIRENNADNSFDSNLSMKDCRRMIYNAVVALLAEATNSKYEAANYSDTLDEQDKLAADSTDVRGDLTVIAMSNYQTQLLLNRISMNFSSQIILETVEQVCAARKDVLGDSDLDEKSDAGGE